ncbi:ABC transporter ATP-binding protein [Paenibacillus graminis]|uniref:Bacitracin ABC transporter ATP-binding protein n=1 Tax=Paenibacillus graminis TaxID=189425 RepID=A0A089M5I5_9BACL|nr:ABC transporter ATP-binding protein [Paenibacillus graminis]AIQ68472.1 bacitracin ABC transporter ATP-binding protein [Paenibacillus graminis]MEC0168831.1 ABC transporter ATP-binding protein [Paenibacillus graminis]
METMIRINQLSKSYKQEEIVSKVTMRIEKGEIYGFLGPNGAGKTTIMKMILNLVKPTSGEIFVLNQPVSETSFQYLKHIGSIIEYPVFYDRLTAAENLKYHCAYARFHGKDRIPEVLQTVGLTGVEDKKVHEFSLGMKQRLGIARAILTGPAILILDEPINGLDPVGIKDIRMLLLKLKKEYGMTILVSSHIVSEMETIADTIGIINQGQLIREVKMTEVRKENIQYLEIKVANSKQAALVLKEKLNLHNFEAVDTETIRVYQHEVSQSVINKELVLNDILVNSIETQQSNLEEYFLNLIHGGR